MIKNFNILATTFRGNESEAISEIEYLLREIGDSAPVVKRTGISGLIGAKIALSPTEAIAKLRDLILKRPFEFRYTFRIIPVQVVVNTNLRAIAETARVLAGNIGENETFRVTVEKRHSQIHARDIIENVATDIKRNVDLTSPDKIILVEVVGRYTGLSLISKNDLLQIQKEKML